MSESKRIRKELTGNMPTGTYRLSEQRFSVREKRAEDNTAEGEREYEMYDFYSLRHEGGRKEN